MGWGVYIYNPVREKERCGRCVALLMSGFMPKATVAKRTSQRARRLGLHTVAPTAFTAGGAQGVAPGGNGARLAQSDLRAQPRVASRRRLVILRSRNDDEAAGCGPDGAIQGGAGDWASVSKTTCTITCGVARSELALKHGSETRL